jgi:hypothetical protein
MERPSSNIGRDGNDDHLDIDNAFDTSGNRNRLLFFPNRAQTESRINEIPRAQPSPQFRPDAQADLWRRRQ